MCKLPAAVSAVPTMLIPRERQLLHWLASNYVRGEGRIVDGGCFLGGSTAALASGLAAREDNCFKNKNKRIASYDLFRVEPYTLVSFRDNFTDSTIGASFRADYDANIAPWSDYVEVFEGDITQRKWSGEPIELLFIDVAKTWGINNYILEQFLPSLIPGRSIIIQQDYIWGAAPWIHITMELLAPSVTILDSMQGSVAYLLTKPVPQSLIGAKLQEELSKETKLELMDRAVNRWTGYKRGFVELARVYLYWEVESRSMAQDALADVLARYPDEAGVQICGKYVGCSLAGEKWWAA